MAQTTSDEEDISVNGMIRDSSDILSLLRSEMGSTKYQFCFIFGNKNWTKRRSSHAILTIMTVTNQASSGMNSNKYDVTCFCHDYRLSKKCVHFDGLMNDESNRIRFVSIAERCNTKTNKMRMEDEWGVFQASKKEWK